MTGRDLISASLRLIGAIAPGETLAAQEATDGLSALNRMLGSWSNEKLLIHAITRETPLTLTPGTAAYTLGTAGNITTRPQWIESALLRNETPSPAIEIPIKVIRDVSEWAHITAKDTQAEYPTHLYDDGNYAQRTVTLYPVPSTAHKLVLFTARPLTEIATLDTSVSLPPGYEEALTYNFAIRIAPEYGKGVSPEVMAIAVESKAAIKRANHRPAFLRCESALTSSGSFDIIKGEYR